jgi:hypothetical protein
MKKIIGIILLGLLCYYGVRYSNHMNSGEIKVSPPLVTIVNEWKATMHTHHLQIAPFQRIRMIIVVDDSVVDFDAGLCNKQLQFIYISKSTIKKGYWATKAAVWHELGHYVFELEHGDGIMSTYIMEDDLYEEGWYELEKQYLNECKAHEETGRH